MKKRIVIKSEVKNLRIIEKAIDEVSSEMKFSEDNYGKIMVSAMEAVNNAIIHGNKSDSNKTVIVEIKHIRNQLKICVEDEGPGFDPGIIPDPTKPENIEKLNGRGIFLMSRLTDKIEFNEKGNRVTMTFKDVGT
ncbi:MAG: ATP-binding protein [Bacteroidales bacterium]